MKPPQILISSHVNPFGIVIYTCCTLSHVKNRKEKKIRNGLVPILRLRIWLKPTHLSSNGNSTLNPAHTLIPIPQRQTVSFV
jgi:hypothetical protein